MTDPVTPAATAATYAGVGGFLAASFGGLTVEHFLLGTGCYFVGSSCRFALKISSAADTTQPIMWGRALAGYAVSPLLGAFAATVVYFAAAIGHFEGDAAIGILLATAALRGAEGIQYLSTLVSKFAPSKLGSGESKP